ncbi:MAG: glycosyltransferase [Bacteroidia bacterium]|nr:glycosyltransferase [Bacteroidia bacterium]
MRRKRVFIAPLDWGLGHATRSARLIDLLLEANAEVFIGSSGTALQFLKLQYPSLSTFPLPGYNVSYARNHQQVIRIMSQVPRLAAIIREENQQLKSILKRLKIDAIISDNRYGIHDPGIPSVFVCHQLNPILPSGWRWFEPAVSRLHKWFIRPFDQVWIPDFEGMPNLSGDLSHRLLLPDKARFIGPLSRFQSLHQLPKAFGHPILDQYPPEVLAIISGPEPHRTLLETIIEKQSRDITQTLWLVKGKTDQTEISKQDNLISITHLSTDLLALAISRATTLISRSGYSSIMDYQSLGVTKPVFIPTPGQTEQEYLAMTLKESGYAQVYSQQNFVLKDCIHSSAILVPNNSPEIVKNQQTLIGEFLADL